MDPEIKKILDYACNVGSLDKKSAVKIRDYVEQLEAENHLLTNILKRESNEKGLVTISIPEIDLSDAVLKEIRKSLEVQPLPPKVNARTGINE